MNVLKQDELKPGMDVWLETYERIRPHLLHVIIQEIEEDKILYLQDGKAFDSYSESLYYNVENHWRCWDEKPTLQVLLSTPWATPEELAVGPDGAYCRTCYRRQWVSKGCYKCYIHNLYFKTLKGKEYVGKDELACRFYLSEKKIQKEAREEKKRREEYWAEMKEKAAAAPPSYPVWYNFRSLFFYDDKSPSSPHCPVCDRDLDGPYSTCIHCGAKIIVDKRLKAYFKPVLIETRNCTYCGGKRTFQYYGSHLQRNPFGFCTACGMFRI